MDGTYPCKLKGSELYRLNSLSQWRQDVKPESWAENNPLVKAVLSIHLWKKALWTPPDSQPAAPGHLNTHTLSVQTHTYTHIQECFAWIWHPCIDVRPPSPSVLSVCARETVGRVLHFAEMCVSARHWLCRLNVCLCVCLRLPAHVCVRLPFFRKNACACDLRSRYSAASWS